MNIKKELCKVGTDGMCQIKVRVDISRTYRPRLRTGLFIHPELWDSKAESPKKPKRGNTNLELIGEYETVSEKLSEYCLLLTKMVKAANGVVEVTTDWIDRIFALHNAGYLVKLDSYADILAAEQSLASSGKASSSIVMPDDSTNDDQPAGVLLKNYEQTSFYQVILQYCKHRTLAPSRVKVYKVLARQLRRFELFVQHTTSPLFSLNYETMSMQDLENFRDYVRNEYKYKEKYPAIFRSILEEAPKIEGEKYKNATISKRSENYLSCLLKRFAAVFHYLQETGQTTNDPFKGFDLGQERYGKPIYLTREERNIILDFDLSAECEVLQQQRDIFIFHCMVGCRVGDLVTFTRQNITNGVLEYVPRKNRRQAEQVKVRVPLNEVARSLVEKYEGVDRRGRLFPFLSSQKYNERLKEIFRKCGITRIVQVLNPTTGDYEMKPICDVASSHMARRTFIGVSYKLTHDPNIICKMTGHSEGSRAFNRYRSIDDDDLSELTSKIV